MDILANFNVYNPGSLPKSVLLEEFSVRHGLLDKIARIIQKNQQHSPIQHCLLLGARGMGKSTMLYTVAYHLEDHPDLRSHWLPLIFSEENYGIGDLADFWLEALSLLERTLSSEELQSQLLLKENPEDLAQQAENAFLKLLSSTNKRCVLLLDNINDVFSAISDSDALLQLRQSFLKHSEMMLIGTSASAFPGAYEKGQPFFEFFQDFTLERFNQSEVELTLTTLAERRNDTTVLQILKNEPERINVLRILTGGNPRLIKMVYRLLHEGASGGVKQDLQRLLDECTPYFKHRIENLTVPARRVFDAIARQWDPIPVKSLTVSLRKPSNYISSQIKRLIEEGLVEEVGGTEKKKIYQVAERFYNIYYLMRYSRIGQEKLDWLVSFMKMFYTLEDFYQWEEQTKDKIALIERAHHQNKQVIFLSNLTTPHQEKDLLRERVQESLQADSQSENLQDLTRIIYSQLASQNLEDMVALSKFLSQLPLEEQKKIHYQPNQAKWWHHFGNVLTTTHHYKLSELAYRHAIQLNPNDANLWNNLGNLLKEHLNRNEEAEQAFLKALELNPQNPFSWNSLGSLLIVKLGHNVEAEQAYRNAIELDLKFAYPWNCLGNLLQDRLAYSKGNGQKYQKSIELDPDYIHFEYGLENIPSEKMDRYNEVEKMYRKSIELNPKYDQPWNGLGYLLHDHLANFPEAEIAFLKAIELNSNNALAWNGLGNTLKSQGNYDGAEMAYRKAIGLDVSYPHPYFGLASLLYNLGKDENEMIQLISHGVSLKPFRRDFQRFFLRICNDLPDAWKQILPKVLGYLSHHPEKNEVYKFALTGMVRLAKWGEGNLVESWIQEKPHSNVFEPLLLALRSRNDKTILPNLAPERQELVNAVLTRIEANIEL